MKLKITRTFTATHSHRVPPDAEFCHVHSHDWRIVVEIEGRIDGKYGWIIDFEQLERDIEAVTSKTALNDVVENPTTERLAVHFGHEMAWRLPDGGPVVTRVELWETPYRSAIFEPENEKVGFGPEIF